MDYILLQGEDARTVQNYLPQGVWEGFKNSSRYALCAMEGNKVIGVCAFDAFDVMHILSIRTLEDYRGQADSELLSNILKICDNLGCEGAYYEIYDEDDPVFWEPLLRENSFIPMSQNELYQIPLTDLEFNPDLDSVRVSDHILSLSKVKEYSRAFYDYGNKLIDSGSFDKFCSGLFQEDLSSVYVNDNGEIEGCLLISDQGGKEGFTIEYANTEGCKDITALFQMFKYSTLRIMNHYSTDDLSGYALAVNADTAGMIKKAFPHAKVADHCLVFAYIPEE